MCFFCEGSQESPKEGRQKPKSPITSPPQPTLTLQDSLAHFDQHCAEVSEKECPAQPQPVPLQRLPKLDDSATIEDLKSTNVRDLKILLALHRVDFKSCLEKSELIDKVTRLWQDNRLNKDIPRNAATEMLCKVCMDAPLDSVLLECGHIAACAKQLAECPICRQYVVRVVRIFKA